VAKNNFFTDNFSTVGGLSFLAYGSSSYFQTVSDQIKQNSLTKQLDYQLPSNLLLDYLETKTFLKNIFLLAINSEYITQSEFTDFIDIYTNGVETFNDKFTDIFISNTNSFSDYSTTYSKLVEESIGKTINFFEEETDLQVDIDSLSQKIHNNFLESEYLGKDIVKVIYLISQNPHTKISKAPPNAIVSLESVSQQDKDYRGAERYCSYLTKQQYYDNVGYVVKNGSIKNSVSEGYIGYPSYVLNGESLYNSDTSQNVNFEDLDLSQSAIFNSKVVLSEDEQQVYNINLASLPLNN